MPGREQILRRLRWVLGVLTPWVGVWLLLGLRILPGLRNAPNPFLQEFKLTDVMLNAVYEWVLAALVAYLVIGLLLALLAQVAIGLGAPKEDGSNLDFRGGLLLSAGALLWFHGALYVGVPAAMASVPVLRSLPMGLSLLLLLGGGSALLWAQIRRCPGRFPLLRTGMALLLITLPLFIPHDSFRRLMPSPAPVEATAPRVLLVGLDAMRQDFFEEIMPAWKAPGGVSTLSPAPSTRKLWNLVMGADPAAFDHSMVMPARWELEHPEHLQLLVQAHLKGTRTAFLINDPLTLSFGLQPNLFTTVYEPQGGWKYWFTLGYGTAWPVYSWVQNHTSIVETSNAWSDTSAYWRDVERSLEGHHWVSSHLCDLHAPITLRRTELQSWRGWSWLWDSAAQYRSSMTPGDLAAHPIRQTWRGDALLHYRVRMKGVLKELEPLLPRWTARYPALSGVVFSDHGETHLPAPLPDGSVVHLSGMHGYWGDADSLRIALHPFGRTTHALDPSKVWSLLDLRDALARWMAAPGKPLHLTAEEVAYPTQFVSIRADFEIPKDDRKQAVRNAGLQAADLIMHTHLNRMGTWFTDPPDPKASAASAEMVLSRALAEGSRLTVFNPIGGGQWERIVYQGHTERSREIVAESAMRKELAAFPGTRRVRALTPEAFQP